MYPGEVHLLIHFLGNFRKKTKKVPTHSLFRKLSEISPKFPKKLEALLLVKQLGKGNFLDSRKFPNKLEALLLVKQLGTGNIILQVNQRNVTWNII